MSLDSSPTPLAPVESLLQSSQIDTSAALKKPSVPVQNAWKPIKFMTNAQNGALVQTTTVESIIEELPVSQQDQAISEQASQHSPNSQQEFAPVLSKRARKLQKQKTQQSVRPLIPVRTAGPSPTKLPGSSSGNDDHSSECRSASSPKLLKVSKLPGLVPAPKPVVSAWGQIEPCTNDSFISRPSSTDSFVGRPTLSCESGIKSAPNSPKLDSVPSSCASSVTESTYTGDYESGSANVTPRKGKKASWTALSIPVGSAKARSGFTTPAQRSNGPPNRDQGKNMTAVRTRRPKPDQNTACEPSDAQPAGGSDSSSKRGYRTSYQHHNKHRVQKPPAGAQAISDDVQEHVAADQGTNDDVSVLHVVSSDNKPDLVDQVESGLDMMSVSVESIPNSPQHQHQKHRRPYYLHPMTYHYDGRRSSYSSRPTPRYGPPFTYMPPQQQAVYYPPPPVMHVPYTGPAPLYVAAVPAIDMESLQRKIVSQINYYFSMENLCHDLYLRTHMSASGWVELSVLASFNRVRVLTDSVPVLQQCLAVSKTVELSPDMLSIRRRNDWQRWVLDPTTAAGLVPPVVASSSNEGGVECAEMHAGEQPTAVSQFNPSEHAYVPLMTDQPMYAPLMTDQPMYAPLMTDQSMVVSTTDQQQLAYMPVTTIPEGSAAGCLDTSQIVRDTSRIIQDMHQETHQIESRLEEPRKNVFIENVVATEKPRVNIPGHEMQPVQESVAAERIPTHGGGVVGQHTPTPEEENVAGQDPCDTTTSREQADKVHALGQAIDTPGPVVSLGDEVVELTARCGTWALPMIISTPVASVLDDRFLL